MLIFTNRKYLREPQVERKSRRVREYVIALITKQKNAICLTKRRFFLGGTEWFAQTHEISLFASPVGQVEYLPASGPGAD